MLDDATRFAEVAGAADVRVTLEIWPHMIHAWPLWNAHLEPGRRAPPAPARLSGNIFEAAVASTPKRLQQPALAKISEIAAGGPFDEIDGEFEQAHFPGVIDTLDNGAEGFICALDPTFGPTDHCVD